MCRNTFHCPRSLQALSNLSLNLPQGWGSHSLGNQCQDISSIFRHGPEDEEGRVAVTQSTPSGCHRLLPEHPVLLLSVWYPLAAWGTQHPFPAPQPRAGRLVPVPAPSMVCLVPYRQSLAPSARAPHPPPPARIPGGAGAGRCRCGPGAGGGRWRGPGRAGRWRGRAVRPSRRGCQRRRHHGLLLPLPLPRPPPPPGR